MILTAGRTDCQSVLVVKGLRTDWQSVLRDEARLTIIKHVRLRALADRLLHALAQRQIRFQHIDELDPHQSVERGLRVRDQYFFDRLGTLASWTPVFAAHFSTTRGN